MLQKISGGPIAVTINLPTMIFDVVLRVSLDEASEDQNSMIQSLRDE
jgi:hypothetical protein